MASEPSMRMRARAVPGEGGVGVRANGLPPGPQPGHPGAGSALLIPFMDRYTVVDLASLHEIPTTTSTITKDNASISITS